ncbi:hypothetical protein EV714DRAFT_278443 [Schizophyllum commune]
MYGVGICAGQRLGKPILALPFSRTRMQTRVQRPCLPSAWVESVLVLTTSRSAPSSAMKQPQLPADYVAVEAERCGFGEVELAVCAPATEAQRSYPGKAAHRNDKNKGAAERKRAAKLTLP